MIRMICRSGQPERQPQMVPLRFQFFQDHRSVWPFIGNDVRGMFYNIPQIRSEERRVGKECYS